jgi:hypothetical protein
MAVARHQSGISLGGGNHLQFAADEHSPAARSAHPVLLWVLDDFKLYDCFILIIIGFIKDHISLLSFKTISHHLTER